MLVKEDQNLRNYWLEVHERAFSRSLIITFLMLDDAKKNVTIWLRLFSCRSHELTMFFAILVLSLFDLIALDGE